MDQPRGGASRQQAARADQTHHPLAQASQSGVWLSEDPVISCCGARPCPGQSRGRGVRPARGRPTSSRRSPPGAAPRPRPLLRARPAQSNCGRPTCSAPSSSSGRIAASTWWLSWTITVAFIGYGLHASQSKRLLVLEVLRAALANYGPARGDPDRQRQPVRHLAGQERALPRSWRSRGIRQVVAAPRRPQTLGDQDRTLLGDAVAGVCRGGRLHGLRRCAKADWTVASTPLQLPKSRIRASTAWCRPTRFFGGGPGRAADLEGTRGGQRLAPGSPRRVPREPFYLTGQVAGQPFRKCACRGRAGDSDWGP